MPILTSSNIQKILPTIISRSQVVQFSSVSNEIIEIELLEMGYPELSAKIVSRLTNSANEAVEIASSDFFLDLVEKVKDINNILATKEEPLVIYFNENSSIIYQDNDVNDLFISLMVLYQKDYKNLKHHPK